MMFTLRSFLELLLLMNMFTIGMCNIWTMLQSTHIQSHLSQRLSTHPRNIHDMANAQNINADTICKSHKDCSVGKFCDKHYSLCFTYRTLGEPCREDSHCESNNICIYGQCEKTPKEASKGSRCNSDNDCELDMCCARRHGEKICQLKLKLGQKCYVPKGGLDYSLNQQCPCSDGLICRHSSANSPQMKISMGIKVYLFECHCACGCMDAVVNLAGGTTAFWSI